MTAPALPLAGPPSPEPDLLSTAIHESCHVVLFHRFGFPVQGVSIERDETSWGRCYVDYGTDRPLQAAVALIAGGIGEAVLTGRDLIETCDRYGYQDFERAEKLCDGLYALAADTLIAYADRLIRDHADTIRALAGVLMERRRLDGDELTALLRARAAA